MTNLIFNSNNERVDSIFESGDDAYRYVLENQLIGTKIVNERDLPERFDRESIRFGNLRRMTVNYI